jgi:hypothetical protein
MTGAQSRTLARLRKKHPALRSSEVAHTDTVRVTWIETISRAEGQFKTHQAEITPSGLVVER